MGTSLYPSCGIAPPQLQSHLKPQVWRYRAAGVSCLLTALKSPTHLWEEGKRMILFTKRLFHNHAPSLLDLLSYRTEISCCGSTGDLQTEHHLPGLPWIWGCDHHLWVSQAAWPRPLSLCSVGRGWLSPLAPSAANQLQAETLTSFLMG